MRILFAAYCMFNNENGDSLIGVYKRSLRVGLEMRRRGHDVWIFCPGREDYRDQLTDEANAVLHFLDFPLRLLLSPSAKLRRRYYRMAFRKLNFDIIVVGESPLAGTLLESTACAMILGIRLVVLDNAYAPWLDRAFLLLQGPLFDGVALTGPASLQPRRFPSCYCPAPPYLEGSSAEAGVLLAESGLRHSRLVTVLGYEQKAEKLAIALLPKLAEHDCGVVFLSPRPEETRLRLRHLPPDLASRTLVLPPPAENLLFGMLKSSNLAIGKCGFMQVSECLALETPFLAITYRGCFPVWFLPRRVRRFLHATATVNLTRSTLEAAIRLVLIPPQEMRGIHDGKFDGKSVVADFLEHLPAARRNRKPSWVLRRFRFTCFLTFIGERIYGGMYATAKVIADFRLPYKGP